MSDAEEKIQQTLKSSPAVQELLSKHKDVRTHRQVFQMEGKGAETNFTITQLANDRCLAAAPLTLMSVEGRTAMAIHYIGPGMAGHPGIVHGGVIATIFDEVCGQAGVTHFEAVAQQELASTNGSFERQPDKGVLAVTAQLSVGFKSPARTQSIVVTRAVADADKSSAKKAAITAQMWHFDLQKAEDQPVLATSEGLYIRPRAMA